MEMRIRVGAIGTQLNRSTSGRKIENSTRLPLMVLVAVHMFVSNAIPNTMDTVWTKTVGSTTADTWHRILPRKNGKSWVLGHWNTSRMGYYGIAAMIDSMGDTLWTKRLDYFHTESCDTTSDGCLLVIGTARDDNGTGGFSITKIDGHGNTVASRVVGTNMELALGQDIRRTQNGYLIWGRTSYNEHSKADAVVCYLNESLNIQWSRRIGGPDWEELVSVTFDVGGNVVAMGNSGATPGENSVWIVKLSGANGEIQWQKRYRSYEYTTGSKNDLVHVMSDGNIVAISRNTNAQVWILLRMRPPLLLPGIVMEWSEIVVPLPHFPMYSTLLARNP